VPFSITSTGDWSKTSTYLAKMSKLDISKELAAYGQLGVYALAAATPKRSGKTASSWYSRVSRSGNTWFISWYNSNVHEGVPIAILIQYGHGTSQGAYIQGIDYINPAIRPVFDMIVENVWKVVTSG
jgi:hypothetical protein